MRGAAQKEGEQRLHRSLTTRQLFIEWQIAPSAIHLLMQVRAAGGHEQPPRQRWHPQYAGRDLD
eukprot:5840817-Pyramimonas_sp.AAC.1